MNTRAQMVKRARKLAAELVEDDDDKVREAAWLLYLLAEIIDLAERQK